MIRSALGGNSLCGLRVTVGGQYRFQRGKIGDKIHLKGDGCLDLVGKSEFQGQV